MAYYAMNEQQVTQYARQHTNIFPENATLECSEIGDGNLNLVFMIRDRQSGKSAIFKQALPYAKVVGESWPLTLDRARIESEALEYQASLCPHLVPALYAYDNELSLIVMEDLSDHTIMRKGLIGGERYPLFADHISTFLAQTLFFSSDLGMDQQMKKWKVKQFINPELCKITEDLIFDHPFRDADTNNINAELRPTVELLWQDEHLLAEVALLRELFLTKAEALLHGDLHTGSIFITTGSTKVIDPEFAYYGPIAFDLSKVIGNLLLNYAGQVFWSHSEQSCAEYRTYLLHTIADINEQFGQKFMALWLEHGVDYISKSAIYQEQYMTRILQQSFGFAGCVLIRRVVGLAKVADIEQISDPNIRLQSQKLALAMGSALIKQHRNFHSVEDAIATIVAVTG